MRRTPSGPSAVTEPFAVRRSCVGDIGIADVLTDRGAAIAPRQQDSVDCVQQEHRKILGQTDRGNEVGDPFEVQQRADDVHAARVLDRHRGGDVRRGLGVAGLKVADCELAGRERGRVRLGCGIDRFGIGLAVAHDGSVGPRDYDVVVDLGVVDHLLEHRHARRRFEVDGRDRTERIQQRAALAEERLVVVARCFRDGERLRGRVLARRAHVVAGGEEGEHEAGDHGNEHNRRET